MKKDPKPMKSDPALSPPNLRELEPAPEFKDELHARRWNRKMTNRQEQLNAAWSKYPPGTKLYASAARGIPLRTRAGIGFTGKAVTTVEVTGEDAKTIADRVSRGEAIVSPLGASAICRDDGLIVNTAPQMTRGERAEADAKAAEDRAELERLRAENARLRAAKAPESTDGRPARLAPPDTAGEFGEDKSK